jgi:hypothetical protein
LWIIFAPFLLMLASLFEIACGGKDENQAERAVQRAVDEMRGLSSYRLAVQAPREPGSTLAGEWETNYAGMNRYRVRAATTGSDASWREYCDNTTRTSNDEDVCQNTVSTFSERAILDSLLADGKLYARLCSDGDPDSCTPWWFRPADERIDLPSVGPDWLWHPESALVAADIARNVVSAQTPGEQLSHLRGDVNPADVRSETWKYLFGETPNEDGNTEDEREVYDRRPVIIDIWLSPETQLVERIAFTECRGPSDCDVKELTYSHFNDAAVESPALIQPQ